MNQEQQRELAIACGFSVPDFKTSDPYMVLEYELAAYTAAVEAKERERCIEVCHGQHGFQNCIERIRELK